MGILEVGLAVALVIFFLWKWYRKTKPIDVRRWLVRSVLETVGSLFLMLLVWHDFTLRSLLAYTGAFLFGYLVLEF